MKDTFTQMVRMGLCILIVAGILYAADALYFAPRRIPPCVPQNLPAGHICPEPLLAAWQTEGDPGNYKIVWIDARSESDYELNHLIFSDDRMFPIRPGAEMQQMMDAAIERLIAARDRGVCIVVFCTESCNSSDQVAEALRDTGLLRAPIYVLEGGWPALKKLGIAGDS